MQHLIQHNSIATDREVIEKIVAGEAAFFEILIRRYNSVLYKIARGYGFNHQDAQDLMQETHIAAYQNLKQFAWKASYKTWISKIMMHKCLYKINHGYQKNEQPSDDRITETGKPLMSHGVMPDPEQASVNKEFTGVLEAALQKLPLIYRTAFVLREIEGFNVQETAEILNITQVNVKVRLNRAKTLLQKELEQYYHAGNLFEFNLVYCDGIVHSVYEQIARLHT
ncbi:MAG TPA: sigma-70 family RNA polymerase sigma factor [Chitinophagaceae bacterium]